MDAEFEVGGLLDQLQLGLRFADRGATSNQALVNRAAPGGDSNTLLSSLDLPSDFLIEVPGIPRLNGGPPRLSPNPEYLRSAEVRARLGEISGLPRAVRVYQPARHFYATEIGRASCRRRGWQ